MSASTNGERSKRSSTLFYYRAGTMHSLLLLEHGGSRFAVELLQYKTNIDSLWIPVLLCIEFAFSDRGVICPS